MAMPKFLNEYLLYDSEVYFDGEDDLPTGDTLDEWEDEMAIAGIRLGLKYSHDRSAFIATATGYAETDKYPDGWVISAFGGSGVSAKHKLYVVLTQFGGKTDIDAAWLAIGEAERQIKNWLKGEVKKAKQSRKNGAKS